MRPIGEDLCGSEGDAEGEHVVGTVRLEGWMLHRANGDDRDADAVEELRLTMITNTLQTGMFCGCGHFYS